MRKTLLIAFALVSIANLIGETIEHKTLIFTTKPLLMPLLAVWLIYKTRESAPRFLKQMTLTGLVFATLGDVLLMFAGQSNSELFFILGLVAFLLTHLFYIGGFSSISGWKNGFLRHQITWILAFFAYPVFLLWGLWVGIPFGMKLPVSIYGGVITIMALSVLNLRGEIKNSVFGLLMSGALLFVLSDSLLALNKFKHPQDWVRVAIMVTYIGGQFLIVKGVKEVLNTSK